MHQHQTVSSNESHLKLDTKKLRTTTLSKRQARRRSSPLSSSDSEKHRISSTKNIRKEKNPDGSRKDTVKVSKVSQAREAPSSSGLSLASANPKDNLAAAKLLQSKAVSNDQEKRRGLALRSQPSELSFFGKLRKKLCCQRNNQVFDRNNSEDDNSASLWSGGFNKPGSSISRVHHKVGHYRQVDRFTSELLQLKVQADKKKGRRGRRKSSDIFRVIPDPEAEAVERRLHLRWLTYHFDKNPDQFTEGPSRQTALEFKASQSQPSPTIVLPSNSNASSSTNDTSSFESSEFSDTSESKESTTENRPSKSKESSTMLLLSKSKESIHITPNTVKGTGTPSAPSPLSEISLKNDNQIKRSNSAANVTENWLSGKAVNLKPRRVKSLTSSWEDHPVDKDEPFGQVRALETN